MSYLDRDRRECRSCRGKGYFEEEITCRACSGLGSHMTHGYDGVYSSSLKCLECNGKGYLILEKTCYSCNGSGYELF